MMLVMFPFTCYIEVNFISQIHKIPPNHYSSYTQILSTIRCTQWIELERGCCVCWTADNYPAITDINWTVILHPDKGSRNT